MSQRDDRPKSGGGNGQSSLPPHFRRNFFALLVDYVSFGVAFSFASPSTVLPAFARTLTDSEPLIGLVGTVFAAGWLLPQLGAAAVIGEKPRKKPYLMAGVYAGRPLFFLLALTVWGGLARYPTAMLAVFLASISLFSLSDGIASVAWFDIMARAVPMKRRGRLVGLGQLLSGVAGIGVGGLVGLILESPRLPYPANYALIFALAAVAFLPSTLVLSLLKEPEGAAVEPRRSLPDFLRQLGGVWRGDRNFRRIMSYRWLVGLMSLALPFYILHATEVVGLPDAVTGWFVSAQMVGGIAASAGLGWLSERRGPLPVIRLGTVATLGSPLLALGIHFAASSQVSYVYLLVYFLLGVSNSFWMLGPINYVLEMAPEGRRALYVGLYNTLAGVLFPAAVLGGVLLRATSHPILYAVTAGGISAGLWVSLGLGEPRPKGEA